MVLKKGKSVEEKEDFEERMVERRVMRFTGLRLASSYFLVYFPTSTDLTLG